MASALGAASLYAGWRWGAVLLAFFIPAALLSRWRAAVKARVAGAVVAPGATRGARQVIANGAVFGVAALTWRLTGDVWWTGVALGALATASADTWATEIGTAAGGRPWSVRTFRPVEPGLSGAVSLAGTLALIAGGVWLGTFAWLAGFDPFWARAGAIAGVTGALADTVLGAVIQERRWCPECQAFTERTTHPCGTPTVHRGGWRAMSNDAVNLAGTLIGGVAGAVLGR